MEAIDRAAEELSAWVRQESPSPDAAGVNAMMDLVEAQVAGDPIARERFAGRDGLGDVLALRAGPDNGGGAILIIAHLDTVHPVGTLGAGLPLRREGDRLFGPGVYDMKGGAYLALSAFQDVARRAAARRPLIFVFSPDEEIGSPTTRDLIEAFARKSEFALVMEPAREGGGTVTARKGVGWFQLEVSGRAAHAGVRHADGRSAIREAARQILAIEAMTDYARGVTLSVGTISGGTASNVVPETCRFVVDLRVPTIKDGERCVAQIRALASSDPDIRLTVTGGLNRPPYERSDASARLFDRARSLAVDQGVALTEVPMTGGGSDGNFTAALGVATLDGLGVEGDGAHTLEEYALLSSIAPRQRLITRLLETL